MSMEPAAKIEQIGREYYLCPALDSLEVVVPPCQWGEQKGVPFESHLTQLESSAAMVSINLALSFHGLLAALCLIGLLIFKSWAGCP